MKRCKPAPTFHPYPAHYAVPILYFPMSNRVSDFGTRFIQITRWMNPSRTDSKGRSWVRPHHNCPYSWVLPNFFVDSKALLGIIPRFSDRGYTIADCRLPFFDLGFFSPLPKLRDHSPLATALFGFVPKLTPFTFNNLVALNRVFDIFCAFPLRPTTFIQFTVTHFYLFVSDGRHFFEDLFSAWRARGAVAGLQRDSKLFWWLKVGR